MYEREKDAMARETAMMQRAGFASGAVAGGLGAMNAIGSDLGARQPEVRAELERLGHAVEELAKVSEALSMRLDTVRRRTGSGTDSNKEVSSPQPVLCFVAGSIREYREGVSRYVDQLHTVLNELEV